MQATRDVLRSQPSQRIGIRKIAAAAGVSVGTITYHFSSVEEIIDLALAEEVTNYYFDLEQQIRAEDDPFQALRLLADATFTEETATHWRLWLHDLRRQEHGPTADEQNIRYRQWEDMIIHLLQRGVKEKAFTCDDIPTTAALLVAAADGLSLRHLRDSSTPQQTRRLYQDLITQLLRPATPCPSDASSSGA